VLPVRTIVPICTRNFGACRFGPASPPRPAGCGRSYRKGANRGAGVVLNATPDILTGTSKNHGGFRMEHGFVGRILDRAVANLAGVKAAPEAFLLLAIIISGVSYFAFRQFERESVSALENKMALQEVRITEYRNRLNGATPEEAATQIEKLTKLLADAQASLSEVKAQEASVDGRPRDPRSLYEDANPIALVLDPKVDLDNKKITFPVVTSSVILGINKSYEFQNWKLACGSTRLYNAARSGTAREFSYAPLTCKIIGSR
jgi:hypothetical protein